MSMSQQETDLFRENRQLKHKLRHLAQALLEIETVAKKRGERFGACDCIDNAGNPYPSQWLADLLNYTRHDLRIEVDPRLIEKSVAPKWSTARQWE